MAVMEKLKIFVVKEPVVAASCLIAGFGLFLPAVVRPILDSWQTAEQVPPPLLNDVRDFLFFGCFMCTIFKDI
nr:fiber protein Fb11 [Zea mays]